MANTIVVVLVELIFQFYQAVRVFEKHHFVRIF